MRFEELQAMFWDDKRMLCWHCFHTFAPVHVNLKLSTGFKLSVCALLLQQKSLGNSFHQQQPGNFLSTSWQTSCITAIPCVWKGNNIISAPRDLTMKSITVGGCYTCFCQLGNYHHLLFQNELTLIDEWFAEGPSSLSCSTRPATVLVIRATPVPSLIEVFLEDIKNNTFGWVLELAPNPCRLSGWFFKVIPTILKMSVTRCAPKLQFCENLVK